MKKGEGKFLKQYKVGYYALVRLEVKTDAQNLDITASCHGNGFVSQGYVEEVPADGYDDWKEGAVNGVKFALEAISIQKAKVVITHIEGLTTDTNPTIVAAAAARAVWDALGIDIPAKIQRSLEDYVLQSWSNGPIFIPTDNFLISPTTQV